MNNQKQEQARTLFFQTDLGKTEIAGMLGISRRTLHNWIRQNNWDRQKDSASVMPSFLAENCYHVINRFTQQLLSAETITHKDADALHKFTITVNKLKHRTTPNENMELFARFIDSVNAKSPESAQLIAPFVDDYIAEEAKNSGHKLPPAKNMVNPQQAATEEELDRQDLEFWAQQGDPIVSNSSAPPVVDASAPSRSSDKAEEYIESFKQMIPGFPEVAVQEFRKFYHENYCTHKPTPATRAA